MGQLSPPLALALGCLVLSTTGLMDTVDRDFAMESTITFMTNQR